MARLTIGAPSAWFSSLDCSSHSFGSNVGELTITRTFPVAGSIATTAPLFEPSAAIATCCASGSRFVWTSSPSRSCPTNSSKSVTNSFFSPVSSSLRDRSRPVIWSMNE